MCQNIESPSASAKAPFWARVMTFLRSMDEAASRTEADDLIDRIDALERRVDALEPSAATSDLGTASIVHDRVPGEP